MAFRLPPTGDNEAALSLGDIFTAQFRDGRRRSVVHTRFRRVAALRDIAQGLSSELPPFILRQDLLRYWTMNDFAPLGLMRTP